MLIGRYARPLKRTKSRDVCLLRKFLLQQETLVILNDAAQRPGHDRGRRLSAAQLGPFCLELLLKRLDLGLAGSDEILARIQRALEAKGAVFIDQDKKMGPGVRLKKPLR